MRPAEARRSASHHDQQLHEVLISRVAGGLDEEDIGAAHVFEQLEMDLAVREPLELGFAERHTEELADLIGEGAVGGAGENLEALVFGELRGLACGRRGRRIGSEESVVRDANGLRGSGAVLCARSECQTW